MSGTIIFIALFVALSARTYTRAQRDAAAAARELPLDDDGDRS